MPADVRWAIANWPEDAERGAVTRFCERHEISRSVFYKIRRRAIEVGPLSVRARMLRQGLTPPSRATLARAFKAVGVSKSEPRKRPRAANRRFVYPAPNCCWQIDAFAWSLADGTAVAIHQVIDDHSRLALATLVAEGETSRAAVAVVSAAVRRWGVPQRLLSDNGLAFNPTRRGFTGKLVDYLVDLGVKPITGKPDRPTTQGKNERFHQTLQKWLNARPPVATIEALQRLVDDFDEYYNNERAHQALDGQTPAEAWAATKRAPEPTPEPRMPAIPASARHQQHAIAPPPTIEDAAAAAGSTPQQHLPGPPGLAPTRRRTRLALHAGSGEATLTIKGNGQVKALSCLFHVATSRAGQTVHLNWNETAVEIFTDHGEHLVSYPRPETTGVLLRAPERTDRDTDEDSRTEPLCRAPPHRGAHRLPRRLRRRPRIEVLRRLQARRRSSHRDLDPDDAHPQRHGRRDHRDLRQADHDPRLAQPRRAATVHEVVRHRTVHDVLRHLRPRCSET